MRVVYLLVKLIRLDLISEGCRLEEESFFESLINKREKKEMKNTKLVLCSAKEVFDSLWNELSGELTTHSINFSFFANELAVPNESGIEEIVFFNYFTWRNAKGPLCFLGGNGYKQCGRVAFVIPIKGGASDELLREIHIKLSSKGRKFFDEAFQIIKLDSENEIIESGDSLKKFSVKKDGKIFYKKEIIKFLYERTAKFLGWK